MKVFDLDMIQQVYPLTPQLNAAAQKAVSKT
jgi:hypothetical protein